MSDEEWGPWIEHDGKGCPCEGFYVEVACAEPWDHSTISDIIFGIAMKWPASSWDWGLNGYTDVLRYRIRKPRALQELKERIATLPEEVDA